MDRTSNYNILDLEHHISQIKPSKLVATCTTEQDEQILVFSDIQYSLKCRSCSMKCLCLIFLCSGSYEYTEYTTSENYISR